MAGYPCCCSGRVHTITYAAGSSPTFFSRYLLTLTNAGASLDEYRASGFDVIDSINYSPSRTGTGKGIAVATMSGVRGLYAFDVADLAAGLSLIVTASIDYYATGRECNGYDTIYEASSAEAYSGATLVATASYSSDFTLFSPSMTKVLYDGTQFWVAKRQKIVDGSDATLTTLGASGDDRILGIVSDDATNYYALMDNNSTGVTKLFHIDGAYSYTLLGSHTASGSGFAGSFSLLDDAIYWIDRNSVNVLRYDILTATFDGAILTHEKDGLPPDSWSNVDRYGFVIYDSL